MNKYTVMAASLVLSLGLVTGCGSSEDKQPNDRTAKGSSAPGPTEGEKTKEGPAYDGPAIPGLAAKPAWSVPARGAVDLGETLLFVKDAKGTYVGGGPFENDPVDGTTGILHTADQPEPLTLEFRDVKTGEVRKTLKVTAQRIAATTWRDGVRALEVRTNATTESDGLSAEKTAVTVTVYGSGGAELGKAEHAAGAFHVHEGHLVEQDGEAGLKLTPVGDGQARTVTCTGPQATCSYDPRNKDIDGGQLHAPLITGAYTFHMANDSTYAVEPAELVMSELATGKKVWSSADVTAPKGVELDDKGQPASGALRVLDVREGRILTAWKSSPGSDTWITATYELAGGKQVGGSTAYSYDDYPGDTVNTEGSSVFSPDHELAAATTKTGTAVWQLADGKEVWAQQEGEKAMTPLRFSPEGVLYGTTGGEEALAVDARTKKVLSKSLPMEQLPLFSKPSGYGMVTTDTGFFVFAPSAP